MIQLREPVIVKTAWDGQELQGELYIGADGLPELRLESDIIYAYPYRPATIPAAWTVYPVGHSESGGGILYDAWQQITAMRQEIIDAQRKAEAEEQREPEATHG